MQTLLPALLLGIIALLIVLAAFKLVVQAIFGDVRTILDRARLWKRRRKLREIDQAIEAKQYNRALTMLQYALMLDAVYPSKTIVEQIWGHHLDVLNRVLDLSGSKGLHLPNLPILEELLQTRGELMRTRAEAFDSHRGLKSKRMRSGHKAPEWAMQEFQKRGSEIEEQLKVNRGAVLAQIDLLIVSLKDPGPPDSVTLH